MLVAGTTSSRTRTLGRFISSARISRRRLLRSVCRHAMRSPTRCVLPHAIRLPTHRWSAGIRDRYRGKTHSGWEHEHADQVAELLKCASPCLQPAVSTHMHDACFEACGSNSTAARLGAHRCAASARSRMVCRKHVRSCVSDRAHVRACACMRACVCICVSVQHTEQRACVRDAVHCMRPPPQWLVCPGSWRSKLRTSPGLLWSWARSTPVRRWHSRLRLTRAA